MSHPFHQSVLFGLRFLPCSKTGLFVCASLLVFRCGPTYQLPATRPYIPPGDPFSLLIASDTPYPWYSLGGPAPCRSLEPSDPDACVTRYAKSTNRAQLLAMSKIGRLTWPVDRVLQGGGNPVATAAGLVVNGDITAFGREWQYRDLLALTNGETNQIATNVAADSTPARPVLAQNFGVFLGLGNHDVMVCDCREGLNDFNSCARNSYDKIRSLYSNVPWIAYDKCSKAYAFDIGDFRFIQLHIDPNFSADLGYWDNWDTCQSAPHRYDPEERLRNDYDCDHNWGVFKPDLWLEQQLAEADTLKKWSVLMFHAANQETSKDASGVVSYRYWSPERLKRFQTLVNKHGVILIFAGHLHSRRGVQNNDPLGKLYNVQNDPVKVILSGASEYNTFLVAEFGRTPPIGNNAPGNYVNVGVVSSAAAESGGDPRFLVDDPGAVNQSPVFSRLYARLTKRSAAQ